MPLFPQFQKLLCQKLNLAPKRTNVIVEFLAHSRMKTLGTVSWDICIAGQDFKVKTYMVKDFPFKSPVLLRKDFHKKSGIHVDYADDTYLILVQQILAVWKDISQHCVNQSGYVMTASSDGKYHLFTDYLISIQFQWSNLK